MELMERPVMWVAIIVGVLIVAGVAGAMIWWEKKTRGGRTPPNK